MAAAALAAGFIFGQTANPNAAAPDKSTKDKSTKDKSAKDKSTKGAPPPDGVNDNQPGVEAGREAKLDTRTNLQLQVAILINGPIDSLNKAQPNQEYAATLDAPLVAGGQLIAPRGTRALLRIAPSGPTLELQLVALEVGGKMVRTDGSRLAPEATRSLNLQQAYSASGARIQVPAGTRLSFTLPETATVALAATATPALMAKATPEPPREPPPAVVAPTVQPPPTPPPPAVSQAGWLLSVSGCGAGAGRSITCSLTLANQGADRAVTVAAGTTGYDAAGNAYRVGSSQVGRAANQPAVSGGSRVPVTITFANVDPSAVRIARLEVFLSWGNTAAERATFAFAGVPQTGR